MSRASYWFILKLAIGLLKFPVYLLQSIPSGARPRRPWSWRKAANYSAFINALPSKSEFLRLSFPWPDHTALRLGKGVSGVYIRGVPELVKGHLHKWASQAKVETITIPGYWYYADNSQHLHPHPLDDAPPAPGEKVALVLHGGAYILLSAHPATPAAVIPRALVANTGKGGHKALVRRAFSVEYRLARYAPEHNAGPFPAALLDALAAYAHLVRVVGFKPEDIIVVGDSAGGNLAHALVRYLAEMKIQHQNSEDIVPGTEADTIRDDAHKVLSPPGALVMISPWVDMSGSHSTKPSSSQFTNMFSDVIRPPIGTPASRPHPPFIKGFDYTFPECSPYLSPASTYISDSEVSFQGFPRTFVSSGDAEVLLDQIRTFVTRMRTQLGDEEVVYFEAKDAFHDAILFPWSDSDTLNLMQAISEFINTL